ncbi:hypothetical protein PSET11_03046 [Arthrobacter ulcerisalmonis]|uniref:Uncharacterized protein n=1 Tax=Arthrobacter ulcerisalmonis TaxID=2483813 RepID=A0A3P5XN40_9MICC|nr:hypothetical protein PSET11_03046 [Arthrobacter ulcerisalmonis]
MNASLERYVAEMERNREETTEEMVRRIVVEELKKAGVIQ